MFFLKPILTGASFRDQKDPVYSARASVKPNNWSRGLDTGSLSASKLTEKQLISPEADNKVSDGRVLKNCLSAVGPIPFCSYVRLAGVIWGKISAVFPRIRQSRDGLRIF